MTSYIALVRGINVGTAKQVSMHDLRRVFEDLGYQDVRTLLRSGNVVFRSPKKLSAGIAGHIEKAFAAAAGFDARFVVLDAERFGRVIDANPFQDRPDPSRVVVGFVPWEASLGEVTAPEPAELAPEELAIGGHAIYQWCPDGISRSTVPPTFWRALGKTPITARNLNTVQKLRDLLGD